MAVYKRKDSKFWFIDISTPNGKRLRISSKTEDKQAAKQLDAKLAHELWEVSRLEKKPRRLWKEACVRWCTEKQHKRSLSKDIANIQWLDRYFGNLHLHDITRDLIEEVAIEKEKENVAPATVNRMLQLIRSILRAACLTWEWTDKIPSVRLRKESGGVIRWITKAQAENLVSELPRHLAVMAKFSLATGLRAANVHQLRWTEIDLDAKHALVHANQSKSKKAIPVPLNEGAIEVLRQVKDDYRQDGFESYVFVYEGKPVRQVSTKAWYKALDRAEIENFRWHDLRHTWASWHVQSGTSLHELQQLGGWSSYSMVLRYAHLSSHQLRDAANRIYDTKLSHK